VTPTATLSLPAPAAPAPAAVPVVPPVPAVPEPGVLEIALEYGPRAPGAARRAVRKVLTDCGWQEERIDDALLVVSELVTNAVVHAAPPLVLRLRVDTGTTGGLQVHVTDGGPARQHASWAADRADDEHGRGTTVVTTLAHHTGTTTDTPTEDAAEDATDPQALIDHWATLDAA
jgi:anti-sigma regulatory factor (Ser/Thr protein kinase)